MAGVISPYPIVNIVVDAQYNENVYWIIQSESDNVLPITYTCCTQQQSAHSSKGHVLSETKKNRQAATLQSINIFIKSKISLKNALTLRLSSKEEIIDFSMWKSSGILR